MKAVVDTNIVFSALLRDGNPYLQHLLLSDTEFFAPRFVMVELFKHKERIVQFSQIAEAEMLDFLHRILTNIHFVNEGQIAIESWARAHRFCHDTDVKDLPFIALSIELGAPLWTSDRKLVHGASARGFVNFYPFEPSVP